MISGMQGLGDNLYQRAVLRSCGKSVVLQTSWPQIYSDLSNVKCVRPATRLRTQYKNVLRSEFANATGYRQMQWSYCADASLSILESLARRLGVQTPTEMTGPEFRFTRITERPYIVVRPACLRREWVSNSRNPKPEYIAEAIEHLRKDFTIVSVADLEPGQEWALEPLPYADITLHKGELPVEQLLSVVQNAAGLVGGVGWVVPAALAYKVPLLLIYGGWGASNSPRRIIGSLDASFIDQVIPNEFCMCSSNNHECNKSISDFSSRARSFAAQLVQRVDLDAGAGDRLVSGDCATV